MTARLPFTKLAVRRLIQAAREEGLRVAGVTVTPDGTITVLETGAPVAPGPGDGHVSAPSRWEDVET